MTRDSYVRTEPGGEPEWCGRKRALRGGVIGARVECDDGRAWVYVGCPAGTGAGCACDLACWAPTPETVEAHAAHMRALEQWAPWSRG